VANSTASSGAATLEAKEVQAAGGKTSPERQQGKPRSIQFSLRLREDFLRSSSQQSFSGISGTEDELIEEEEVDEQRWSLGTGKRKRSSSLDEKEDISDHDEKDGHHHRRRRHHHHRKQSKKNKKKRKNELRKKKHSTTPPIQGKRAKDRPRDNKTARLAGKTGDAARLSHNKKKKSSDRKASMYSPPSLIDLFLALAWLGILPAHSVHVFRDNALELPTVRRALEERDAALARLHSENRRLKIALIALAQLPRPP